MRKPRNTFSSYLIEQMCYTQNIKHAQNIEKLRIFPKNRYLTYVNNLSV